MTRATRKDGSTTDHVTRQYLGSVGKIDNGILAVTTLWASEECYYPLHVMPYMPEKRLPEGKQHPQLRTKRQIALALVEQAQAADNAFSAIVADCFYGDDRALEKALLERRPPHMLARCGAARLGTGRGRPFIQGCGALAAAARVTIRGAPLLRWSHQALVGHRAHAVRLRAGQRGARCVRHDRSARFAFCWWHAASQTRASESSTPPEARKKISLTKALPRWSRLLRGVRAWLTPGD